MRVTSKQCSSTYLMNAKLVSYHSNTRRRNHDSRTMVRNITPPPKKLQPSNMSSWNRWSNRHDITEAAVMSLGVRRPKGNLNKGKANANTTAALWAKRYENNQEQPEHWSVMSYPSICDTSSYTRYVLCLYLQVSSISILLALTIKVENIAVGIGSTPTDY